MKRIYFALTLLFVFTVSSLFSQKNCDYYMPLKANSGFEIKSFNAKDKLQSTAVTTITKVSAEGDATVADMHTVSKDKDENEVTSMDYKLKCDASGVTIDMKGLIPASSMEAFKSMEIKTESTDLQIPASLSTGQKLPDAKMSMKILKSGQQFAELNFDFIDRIVVSEESITVPAGTFKCYKITYTIKTLTKIGLSMKSTSKVVEYFSNGVGVVRTEFYNEKDKLQSYNVISKIF